MNLMRIENTAMSEQLGMFGVWVLVFGLTPAETKSQEARMHESPRAEPPPKSRIRVESCRTLKPRPKRMREYHRTGARQPSLSLQVLKSESGTHVVPVL